MNSPKIPSADITRTGNSTGPGPGSTSAVAANPMNTTIHNRVIMLVFPHIFNLFIIPTPGTKDLHVFSIDIYSVRHDKEMPCTGAMQNTNIRGDYAIVVKTSTAHNLVWSDSRP